MRSKESLTTNGAKVIFGGEEGYDPRSKVVA